MAINFPTSLDTLINPSATDQVATVSHADQHANANDAIEALEAKVGANGSAVTTSHDYKLSGVATGDKAVSLTGSQVITNKEIQGALLTASKIANGGYITDENGNKQIEFSTTTSAVNDVKITNAATGNSPKVEASGTDSNINLDIKGKGTGNVRLGTANLKFPNSDGIANQMLITDGSGSLSWKSSSTTDVSINEYISNQGTGNQDGSWTLSQYSPVSQFGRGVIQGTTVNYVNITVTGGPQQRVITSDWASASTCNSIITLGAYVYMLFVDASNNYRVYRYAYNAVSSGGTLMTISGQSFATTGGANVNMMTDGTYFYFNYKGGNSANDYVISKYSLSGTTLTYVSDITCGAAANVAQRILQVDSSTNIYVMSTTDNIIRKHNSSGTLQATSIAYNNANLTNTNYCLGTAVYIGYNTPTANRPKYQTKISL